MHSRPVQILLVEDSPADVHLAREALLKGSVPKAISVVTDGAQAIDFLRREGEFRNAPRPDLILLDINLPKLNGLEVLRQIKSDVDLRSITVIVLTTSQFSSDVKAAYELRANCYVVKPVDLNEYYAAMRGIEEFWMSLATLPGRGKDPLAGPASAGSETPPASHGSADPASAHLKDRRRVLRIQLNRNSVRSVHGAKHVMRLAIR